MQRHQFYHLWHDTCLQHITTYPAQDKRQDLFTQAIASQGSGVPCWGEEWDVLFQFQIAQMI